MDGGSLVPLFEKGNGGAVKRGEEALIFHFPWFDGVPESAIRLGDYKLMKNLNTGETRLRERMASASDAERQELQTELARHERMVEVHAAGLERLKQGRQVAAARPATDPASPAAPAATPPAAPRSRAP